MVPALSYHIYENGAIGLLELLTAYLANTLFFSLQMIKPIVFPSESILTISSTMFI